MFIKGDIYIYSVEHKNRRFHFNFCNEAKQVDISTFFRFNLHIPGVHNSVPSNVNFGPMKWQTCYLFRLCIIFPVQNICSLIAYTNIMLCWNTWCSDNMALQKQVCGNIRDIIASMIGYSTRHIFDTDSCWFSLSLWLLIPMFALLAYSDADYPDVHPGWK